MNKLKSLFEYQKFEKNEKLEQIINDTEKRYQGTVISPEDLELVSAAGIIHAESVLEASTQGENVPLS